MLGKVSQTKRQIPYDVTYRENLNNRTKQTKKQAHKNRDQQIPACHMWGWG